MRPSPGAARRNAEGFVLLMALWMLLLGGIIAAFVMASGLTTARLAAGAEAAVRKRLAARSALETAAYDLLINGRDSRWAGGARSASVATGGESVTVAASDEERRVDLNSANDDVLAAAFAATGTAPKAAARLARDVVAERERRRFRTLSDAARVAGDAGAAIVCQPQRFTVHSGMAEPVGWRGEVAALDGDGIGGDVAQGRLYRLAASAGGRPAETWIVRITGEAGRPLWLLERLRPPVCTH